MAKNDNETTLFLNNLTLNLKKVRFSEKKTIYTFEKDNDETHCLTGAQRLADWDRLCRLIEPILAPSHLMKIRTHPFFLQDSETSTTPSLYLK